jgi:hypothetical protein
MVSFLPEGLMIFVCRYRPASLKWLAEAGWYPGNRKNNIISVCSVPCMIKVNEIVL